MHRIYATPLTLVLTSRHHILFLVLLSVCQITNANTPDNTTCQQIWSRLPVPPPGGTGSVPVTGEERQRIEKRTQGQSTNKTWFEERTFRLKSSNFGRICKATDHTSFENLAKYFLTAKHVDTPATRHGRKYEEVAVRKYEEQWGVTTNKCGIFVYAEAPFIAASPNRIVEKWWREIYCRGQMSTC